MKVSIRLYTADGITRHGYPVKLIVRSHGKTKRKTISYSPPELWDSAKGVPKKSHPEYLRIYSMILEARRLNLMTLDEPPNIVIDCLLNRRKTREKISLQWYMGKLIEQMRRDGRDGNADAYKYAANQFKFFDPGLTMDGITFEVVESFKRWKLQTASDKTVKNYIGVLRAVYNQALSDPTIELTNNEPFKGVMNGLVVRKRRKRNRYLTTDGLLLMSRAAAGRIEGLTMAEIKSAKISMIQFYLGGADLVDVYHLRKDRFFRGRVLMTRRKLGKYMEEYDVKVFDQARRLMDELDGGDELYLLGPPRGHTGYKTFRRNHLRSLRSLQIKTGLELEPTDERLNSKVMRHTFATRGKFLGVDPDLIRELMGHERSDIDTVYKDRFPESVRDDAHGQIISFE